MVCVNACVCVFECECGCAPVPTCVCLPVWACTPVPVRVLPTCIACGHCAPLIAPFLPERIPPAGPGGLGSSFCGSSVPPIHFIPDLRGFAHLERKVEGERVTGVSGFRCPASFEPVGASDRWQSGSARYLGLGEMSPQAEQ